MWVRTYDGRLVMECCTEIVYLGQGVQSMAPRGQIDQIWPFGEKIGPRPFAFGPVALLQYFWPFSVNLALCHKMLIFAT